jgi:hypothetical protein
MDQDFLLLRTTLWGAAAPAVVLCVPAIPAQTVVDEGACVRRSDADWDGARWSSACWPVSDWT